MNQPHTYKTRTSEVRQSARTHLKALRQQRQRKRKAALRQEPVPETEALSDHVDDAVQRSGGLSDAVLNETAASDPAPDMADDLNDLAVENAAMAEIAEMAQAPSDLAEAEEVEPNLATPDRDEPVEDLPQAPNADEEACPMTNEGAQDAVDAGSEPAACDASPATDLETLPGAGPGLVWMLQQCGIASLKELADTTPEKLSSDLGVVGQILDVSQWIDFAQAKSAE